MEAVRLSETDLINLDVILNKILSDFSTDPLVVRYTNLFLSFIREYKSTGKYLHPEIRNEMNFVIESLKIVPEKTAKEIAQIAKSNCKNCIFHSDNCIINILFVTFKSLELGKKIEFKDLRPNMRVMF